MDKKLWKIYKHTSPSGRCYIGLTKCVANRRWQNGYGYKKTQTKFYYAIQKYGWENFTHEILEDNIETLEKVKERERYWITYYDSFKNGYNMTEGGDTRGEVSVQTREKLSKAKKGKPLSLKTKMQKSEFMKKHPEYYKKWVERGNNVSQEYKTKKIIEAIGKKVAQYDAYGNLIKIYNSLAEAGKETNIFPQNIGRCCKGFSKHSGGYIWRYVNTEPPLKIIIDNRTTQIILGNIHPNSGKKADKELLEKLSKSHIGKSPLIKVIDQYDLQGNFIKTWYGRYAIEQHFGKRMSHISQVLSGKRKTSFGYVWRLHNKDEGEK